MRAPQEPDASGRTLTLRAVGGAGVLGALVLYTLLRVSYTTFYGAFGVAPEDVGLDYPTILFQSAVGVAVMAALVGAMSAIWTIADIAVTIMINSRAARRRRAGKSAPATRTVPWKKVALGSSTIFVLFLLLDEIPRQASEFAERGKAGHVVTWAGFRLDAIASDKYPLLAYRAEPAEVSVVGPESETFSDLAARSSLMYLGTGSDTHVLFDHQTNEVVRVPARTSVVVTRDLARNDPYDFPTVTFVIATILFVVYLGVSQELTQMRQQSETARILGVDSNSEGATR